MNGARPSFRLLGGGLPWHTAFADAVAVADRVGIRLAADPDGPLSLRRPGEDLAGLTLPRTLAVDERGRVLLLIPATSLVLLLDRAARRFAELATVGGPGSEARRLDGPTAIAAAGGDLVVADTGNRRVQVFALGSLALRAVIGPIDADGRPVAASDEAAWEPVDVTAARDGIYVLDRRYGRVHRRRPHTDELEVVVRQPLAERRWTRVAVDRDGRVYVYDPARGAFDVFSAAGKLVGAVTDAGEVRDRFDPPVVRLDHRGRFCVPASLLHDCDPRPPGETAPLESPLAACAPFSGAPAGGLLFDLEGRPARIEYGEPPGPRPYVLEGVWTSDALDSDVHRCQWHRIELELDALPPGTAVEVRTYADAARRSSDELRALPESLWDTRVVVAGGPAPPGAPTGPRTEDLLVQSGEGRFLWIRLLLRGPGYATPVVSAVRTHFPRESYLAYLPVVFSADDESRRFLERFLSVFQTEWDELEQRVEDAPALFDPDAVPAGELLRFLAGWLALPLEAEWSPEQQRRLLARAPELYRRRGTAAGLLDHLRVYLENLVGHGLRADGLPQLVEGFRERTRLLLGVADVAELHAPAPLWSPAVVGRLQLDVFARAGEVRLVSTGDPARDVFHEFAHRFRVFVPAVWVRTADAERMLRRAVESEKPAHAAYDLCLVEPRLRVGVQSTVGLDTLVAAEPVARLACRHEPEAPPSRPPRHRLGLDTVLAPPPREPAGIPIAPGVRVGANVTLT